MKQIALAGLGMLLLVACDKSPTLPPTPQLQPLAAAGSGGPAPREVTAGEGFSCALNARGEAFCWGGNSFGSLGAGDTEDATTPRMVAGGVTFSSLTTAGSHTCALAQGGMAFCWGQNGSGEVGSETGDICLTIQGRVMPCSLQPVPVPGDVRFQSIDAGWRHNCGLTSQGEAFCWGWNLFGQLGASTNETCVSDALGSVPCSRTPVRVAGGLKFSAISAGFWQTCGLTFDDQTYCWGNNVLGTFGNGSTGAGGPTPVPGASGVLFASLSSGAGAACGITRDRITMCWGGFNVAGELGDGTNTPHFTPQPIAGDFVKVRSVNTMTENNILAHVCGIATQGEARCWGSNRRGQLGVATAQTCTFVNIVFTCSNVPVTVAGEHRFQSIAAGFEHSCGATKGEVLCWGRNDRGQLGDGTTTDRPEPVAIALP